MKKGMANQIGCTRQNNCHRGGAHWGAVSGAARRVGVVEGGEQTA